MKSQNIERNVVTNAGERSEFRTDSAAKIFHMLISGLYSNKPQSITRETWTNARDAHAETGILDRPFDVTFPSLFNPTFKVRDYGPGMDHNTIMNLYTSLGTSTKEDSNVGVGKFGIGSKSPFAYTDTFSVVAFDGETARHYNAVIESGGIPALYLMAQTKSTEETGIEVSFPVSTSDVNAFRKAAQRICVGFDVKPNVVGLDEGEEFEGWNTPEVITEGKGWRMLSNPVEGHYTTAYAKMGCVLYPINTEALENIDEDVEEFLNSNVVIDFPIGSLEMTPSRETLSYGRYDPTVPAIEKRVTKIMRKMLKTLMEDYKKCTTYWDACAKFAEHQAAKMPRAIKTALKKEAKWNGESLHPFFDVKGRKNTYTELEFCEVSGSRISHKTLKFDRWQSHVNVYAQKTTVMVIEDVSLPFKEQAKRAGARLARFKEENKDISQIVWVKFHGRNTTESQELVTLLERLDGIKIYDMHDLELPDKQSTRYARKPVMVRKFSSGYYRNFDTKVTISVEEMETGGYYIPLERMQPILPAKCSSVGELIQSLHDCDALPKGPIYGAPKSLWKDFEGDEWINVCDLAVKFFEDNACEEQIVRAKEVADILSTRSLRYLSEKVTVSALPEHSLAADCVNFFNRIKSMDTSKANKMIKLAKALGKETVAQTSDLTKQKDYYSEACKETYPLLLLLEGSYSYNKLDNVTQYVYTCDMAALAINSAAQAA